MRATLGARVAPRARARAFQPIDVALRGPAAIQWTLVDRDPLGGQDEIAQAAVGVDRLANARETVCSAVGDARVCFELRRVR